MSEYSPETQALKDSVIKTRVGPTIITGSGGVFDYLDPDNSDLTIEDFAWGLASTGRFAGQCVSQVTGKRVVYTVCEHSVRMSFVVPPGHEYDALMHEGGESTCGDMVGPLKSICPDYKKVEKACGESALRRFKAPMRDPDLIKRYDIIMWATERRDLLPADPFGKRIDVPLLEERIVPWTADEAVERFMTRFRELAPADVLAREGLAR